MDVDAPYQTIAQAMITQAPAGWSVLEMDAQLGDGYVDTGFCATVQTGNKSFALSSTDQTDVEDTLFKLQRTIQLHGRKPWSRCVFRVFPDGRFKFDVDYDD